MPSLEAQHSSFVKFCPLSLPFYVHCGQNVSLESVQVTSFVTKATAYIIPLINMLGKQRKVCSEQTIVLFQQSLTNKCQ